MFDTVIIDGLRLDRSPQLEEFLQKQNAPFPQEFQTKDLENCLVTYKLDTNGQWYEHVRKNTGKKILWKNPMLDVTRDESWLEKLYWHLKLKKLDRSPLWVDEHYYEYEKRNLTSTLNIYAYDLVGDRYMSLEYELKIVDGQLVSHQQLMLEYETDQQVKERYEREKQQDEKLNRLSQQRKKLLKQWYYPFLKQIYNPLVFFLRLGLQQSGNVLAKTANHLRKV